MLTHHQGLCCSGPNHHKQASAEECCTVTAVRRSEFTVYLRLPAAQEQTVGVSVVLEMLRQSDLIGWCLKNTYLRLRDGVLLLILCHKDVM